MGEGGEEDRKEELVPSPWEPYCERKPGLALETEV